MRAVCLKHVPFEGPGALATALVTHGAKIDRYLVPQDGLPKDIGDLLIVMGGPTSVGNPMVALLRNRFIRRNKDSWNPVGPQACANSATALSRLPMVCSAVFRSCAA